MRDKQARKSQKECKAEDRREGNAKAQGENMGLMMESC